MRLVAVIVLLCGSLPVAQAAVRVYDGLGTWQRADGKGKLQVSYALRGQRGTNRRDFRLRLQFSEEHSHDFRLSVVPAARVAFSALTTATSHERFTLLSADRDAADSQQQRVGTGTCSRAGSVQTCMLEFTVAGQKITLRKVFKPKRRSALRTLLLLSGVIAGDDDTLQWSGELELDLEQSVACTEQPSSCLGDDS